VEDQVWKRASLALRERRKAIGVPRARVDERHATKDEARAGANENLPGHFPFHFLKRESGI